MILILICVAILIGVELILWRRNTDKFDRTFWAVAISVISVIFIFPVALFAPLAGCEEKQCVEEIELLALRNQAVEGTWYLYEFESDAGSEKLLYAYNNMEEYELEGEAYEEEEEYNGSDVKIYESAECTKPIMKRYVAKGKLNAFSFAIGYKDEEIVFFIPEGTILKEVEDDVAK